MTHEERGITLPDGEELVVLDQVEGVAPPPVSDPRAEWLRLRNVVAEAPPAEPAR